MTVHACEAQQLPNFDSQALYMDCWNNSMPYLDMLIMLQQFNCQFDIRSKIMSTIKATQAEP